MPTTVILADSHRLAVMALEILLKADPDITLLAQCSSAEEVLTLVAEHRPDVLLIDPALQDMNGLQAVAEIASSGSTTKVAVLMEDLKTRDIIQALQSGARGVLDKNDTVDSLIPCIRALMNGGLWLKPEWIKGAVQAPGMVKSRYLLTPREQAILDGMAAELDNAEIAKKLGLSVKTIKVHFSNIYRKLNVSNRFDLKAWVKEKWPPPSRPEQSPHSSEVPAALPRPRRGRPRLK